MVGKEDEVVSCSSRVRELEMQIATLQVVNERLAQKVRDLEQVARTDTLTGLFNLRAFNETLANEVSRLSRGHFDVLTLVVFDLNKFKRINDDFGHDVGDQALRAVGNALRVSVRAGDTISYYRQHGDEFAVILCGCGENGVKAFVTRFIIELQRQSFAIGAKRVELTAAFGAAVVRASDGSGTPVSDDEIERVFKLADDCQRRSKSTPRDDLPLQVVSTTI